MDVGSGTEVPGGQIYHRATADTEIREFVVESLGA